MRINYFCFSWLSNACQSNLDLNLNNLEMKSILMLFTAIALLVGCAKKDVDPVSDPQEDIAASQSAFQDALVHHDSLVVATNHHDSVGIYHHDSMYHHHDSLFTHHHGNHQHVHDSTGHHNNTDGHHPHHHGIDSLHGVHQPYHPH